MGLTENSNGTGARHLEHRPDIDGLRAFAVIVVVLFHAGVSLFPGGYVGVDVFFVISGFLITSLIDKQIEAKRFSFAQFFSRRVSRLAPALLITLIAVAIAGFIVQDDSSYDRLGKQILFASFGAANIHLAQGVDYFTADEAAEPLVHLWSLGVEEQFYLLWPLTLFLLAKLGRSVLIASTVTLMLCSLALSTIVLKSDPVAAYFLPQYRSFELLIGALLWFFARSPATCSRRFATLIAVLGVAVLVACVTLYSSSTAFPGLNALPPCLATAAVIRYAPGTVVGQFLCSRSTVLVGVVSYPLYLFHQPVIALFTGSGSLQRGWVLAGATLAISLPLAYAVYRFVESPLRARVKAGTKIEEPINRVPRELSWSATGLFRRHGRLSPSFTVIALVTGLAAVGVSGAAIALKDGVAERFAWFNPFADQILTHQDRTFSSRFSIGYQPAEEENSDLFVGDSLMQHYVLPVGTASGKLAARQVSTATQGGCVMLKGVDFSYEFVLNSCDSVRDTLYIQQHRFDTVFISQNWEGYDGKILNAPHSSESGGGTLEKWKPFLAETVRHFKSLSDRVVLIGGHPRIGPTHGLRPNLLITRDDYAEALKEVTVINADHLASARLFFDALSSELDVAIIHPEDVWCPGSDATCVLHDETWSYFGDKFHAGEESTDFLVERFRTSLEEINRDLRLQ